MSLRPSVKRSSPWNNILPYEQGAGACARVPSYIYPSEAAVAPTEQLDNR